MTTNHYASAQAPDTLRADTEHRAQQLIRAADELSKTATELRTQAEQLAADVEQMPGRDLGSVNSPLFTTKQAAAYLSVGLSTLHQIAAAGGLAPVRLGPQIIRYHQDELDRYIADRASEPQTAQPA